MNFFEIYLLLAVICGLFHTRVAEQDICNLASCVNKVMEPTGAVATSCNSAGLNITGHCCINATMLIGLDLSQCKVQNFHDVNLTESNNEIQYSKTSIQWLDLAENPLADCDNISSFNGLKNLQYLSVPFFCGCPGGNEAWKTIFSENETICEGQVDYCSAYNYSCPLNSHCDMEGPAMPWCDCDEGFYGYKCLRQGTFPGVEFGCGLAGSMIVISAFLWFTQRRNVKIHHN